MEPRGCIGAYDPAAGRYTLTVGSPRPHNLQRALADRVFDLPRDRVRVVAVDTGGGFGPKNALYPEYILCLIAARRLGRPVKWLAERGESFCTDSQGRDNAFSAEAALDGDGRLLAVRVDRLINFGAYTAPRAMVPSYNGLAHLTGVYDVPAAWVRVRGVVSNTACTSVYRGAGRPETVTCCERLIDTAARVAGQDPIAFRRQNLIRPSAMPVTTALGLTYPVLDFEAALDDALERADAAGFAGRRKSSEAAGRCRGLGLSLFVEELHGSPERAPAAIFLDGDTVCVAVATMSAGHGHETTFLQVAAEKMGLPVDRFRLVQGDTARIPDGIGTAASWSTVLGGSSVHLAAVAAIGRGREIAAGLMEVAADDVEFDRGRFRVLGTDRTTDWDEVFAKAPDIRVDAVHDDQGQAFPTGCHVAEVEVDPATGIVDLVRFTAAADPGRMINPMVVAGQLHGGIAQGIGQAWTEEVIYDTESGQLLTGSFMDYAMPRAADLPAIDTVFRETPDPANPLGAKGIGEAGATGATAAFVNAVIDALAPLGVGHIDMPLTPERVWRAIRDSARV
jgi:carbon-monoxide dehydrogenase large subunit